MKSLRLPVAAAFIGAAFLSFAHAPIALADAPVVMTVPGDANNPTVRHPIISGLPVTLKGAVDADSAGADWTWDPGDGGAAYTGVVGTMHWAVWAEHTYSGDPGDFFTATLTVDNGVDPAVSETFEMVVRADTVPNRANTAIAEGLWYAHRNQVRFLGDELGNAGLEGSTIPMGYWTYPEYTSGSNYVSVQGATLNAFEANGHRENGDDSNPYTETVARGMKYLFARLAPVNLEPQTLGGDDRNDNPDTNGNGIGISLDNRSIDSIFIWDPPYQLGMVMDAIVASGNPGAMTTTGPENVINRSYGDVIQDMVDWYAMAQTDSASHGGWEYNAFNNGGDYSTAHDNSASGWAATGLVAAEDVFGATIPAWVKTRNQNGLEWTDNENTLDNLSNGDGIHGYRSPSPLWGPYGTTGAGMVQMSMNGLDATTSTTPDERWVRAENFFRRNFDNLAGTSAFKRYYYGMFNFSKAMRTAKPAPVTIIGTQVGEADDPDPSDDTDGVIGIGCGPNAGCVEGGANPLDWYNDPDSGLAAAVSSYQVMTGSSIGRFLPRRSTGSVSGETSQEKHIHPWGIQILTRTLAQAGPIAVGVASPNPTGENFPIGLDHSRSFHQDPERTITTFEWDIDNNGTFDFSSDDPDEIVTVAGGFDCGAAGLPCSKNIILRVTDDADPPVTATDVVILDISVPPFAPTANAGGPYLICVGDELMVDGSASFDIDEGNSEAGASDTDRITNYEWELDGVSPFDYGEATGETATWTFDTVGVKSIGLRVTDNSALAFPSASETNLTDTDNTFVIVADCIDADLSVSVSTGQTQVIIPEQITLTGTVSNGGPDDAPDVIVTAWLPENVDLVSITPSQGSCAATGNQSNGLLEYECELGDIAAGSSVDIVVVVNADEEGSARFELSVGIMSSQLLQLSDPDEADNEVVVVITLIDEIIIVVKGKGAGSIGLLEILVLAGFVGAILVARRRRLRATTLSVLAAATLFLAAGIGNQASAEHLSEGFYIGGALGSTTADMDAAEFTASMAAAGYDISEVSFGDDSMGWKVTAGYMFNENVGVQASYVDLGELDVQYTASIPPDEIESLLAAGASILPGRGRGFLMDLILQYPFSERVAGYATVGAFFAEPESSQTVISGGSGSVLRTDDDTDFAGSIGLSFSVGERSALRIAYEHYEIDGEGIDFPTASFSYGFGGGN